MNGDSLAVIGDIHGDADRLASALRVLEIASHSAWVFVGDYVNKGPESRSVLEMLIAAGEDRDREVVFLAGNHEVSLIDFISTGEREAFLAHGGLSTMRSYGADKVPSDPFGHFRQSFPQSHRTFLDRLVTHFESEHVLVTHAGYNPARPASRTLADLTTGDAAVFSAPNPFGKLLVFGHYVQHGRTPYVSDDVICLDTGCGTSIDGRLSVLSWPSRQVHQF